MAGGKTHIDYLSATDIIFDSLAFNVRRREALDITVCSAPLARRSSDWRVSEEPSLSDHRQFGFCLKGRPTVQARRSSTHTKWSAYSNFLNCHLDGWMGAP